MSLRITEQYVDNFIEQFHDRLEDLDAELQSIAAASQRAQRGNLKVGETVQGYKPTTVIGETYKEQATNAVMRARKDVSALFDSLDRYSASGRTEVASADEVATVTLALSLDPDEGTLRDLWKAHGHNATLRKAIRQAAEKAHTSLPIDVADAVADNREDARSFALASLSNRWTPLGWAELTHAPSARVDAESVRLHLLGIDVFGKPVS